MSKIEQAKEHVEVLQGLLNDPQPGLSMWQQAIHERVAELNELVNGE